MNIRPTIEQEDEAKRAALRDLWPRNNMTDGQVRAMMRSLRDFDPRVVADAALRAWSDADPQWNIAPPVKSIVAHCIAIGEARASMREENRKVAEWRREREKWVPEYHNALERLQGLDRSEYDALVHRAFDLEETPRAAREFWWDGTLTENIVAMLLDHDLVPEAAR